MRVEDQDMVADLAGHTGRTAHPAGKVPHPRHLPNAMGVVQSAISDRGEGEAMHVRRLSWVGTRTANFAQTTHFFGAVLGLKVVTEEPGFAMFQLPEGEHDYVEVFAADNPEAAYMASGPVPGFLVDDVVQARAELEALGVEMVEPLRWMIDVDPGLVAATPRLADYGWFAFRGPDGNVYNCMQGSTAGVAT